MIQTGDEIKTIVVAGGGTGGHFYPAIAIAQACEARFKSLHPDQTLSIHYIGSSLGIENRLIHSYPYTHQLVKMKGFRRDISAAALVNNVIFLLRTVGAYLSIRRSLRALKPLCVIGTGSYASALPILAARLEGIPYFLQEQNAYPGLITRRFSSHARTVFYAYEEMKNWIPGSARTLFSGNPVRTSLSPCDKNEAARAFDLDPNLHTLFIFGGSQGSRALNENAVKFILPLLKRWPVQVIWQTGEQAFDTLRSRMGAQDRLVMKPYIHNMEQAYTLADLVISRAGALSLAELVKMKKPAILVPLPTAAADHQLHNARALEKSGVVRVVEEKELVAGSLYNEIQTLLDNPDQLRDMQSAMNEQEIPDTLGTITKHIFGELNLD